MQGLVQMKVYDLQVSLFSSLFCEQCPGAAVCEISISVILMREEMSNVCSVATSFQEIQFIYK